MKRVLRQCLAGLLSVVLAFTLLPSAALAEEADGAAVQTAVEQVRALIDALPDAESITAGNRDDVEAQLNAIDEAKLALEDEELDALDITRYLAAVEAVLALDDMAGADVPMPMEFPNDLTGDGQENNPYQISTADELRQLSEYVKGGKDCANMFFKLMADIDLGGSEENQWTPIGNEDHKFQGTFDGGGHTVSGLYINGYDYNMGLFGYIKSEGTVKDLGVSGYIKACSNSFVGGIAGTSYGTITGCHSACNIDSGEYAGGIVGFNNGPVSDCYNVGSINDADRAGGIAGRSSDNISDCYNVGSVSGKDAGGILGRNTGCYSFTNCYNVGKVTGTKLCGGIVGEGDEHSTFTKCYYLAGTADKGIGNGESSTTTEKIQNSEEAFKSLAETLGEKWTYDPFLGRPVLQDNQEPWPISGSGTKDAPFEIPDKETLEKVRDYINNDFDHGKDKYFKLTADIDLKNEEWTPIGSPFQGTFDGDNHTVSGLHIEQSGSNYQGLFGKVSSGGTVRNLSVSGSVTGYSYVGGVVGNNDGGTVENCASSCVVTGHYFVGGVVGSGGAAGCCNTGKVSGTNYVGGVAGNGDVTNCYNSGVVSGSESVGGVVGTSNTEVTNCYNTGAVTGTSSTGGVAGAAYGAVTNCYYLDTTQADKNAMPKTDEQFASGEVAWLLQGEQSGQVWGQSLKDDPDEYPVLTDAPEKKVCKVTFQTTNNEKYDVKYTNKGGTVDLPKEPELDNMAFDHWSVTNDPNGDTFDEFTAVTDDITVYAVGRPTFGGESEEIALTTTYGTELTKDLSQYVHYESAPEAPATGKFTYTITGGNEMLEAKIAGDELKIPGTANAGNYTLTIKATETEPQYSLMSVDTYGTDPVTLKVKVSIKKADPEVTPPERIAGLIYDGTEKNLVTAGTAAGGTMQYSLDGSTYSPSIPKGAEAKEYTVWYKVVGDENHNDTNPQSIIVSIGKATPTVTVRAVAGKYGEDITITAQVDANGVDASLVTGKIQFEDGGTLGIVNVENGTATLTVSGTDRDKQHALFSTSGGSTVTAAYSGNDNISDGSGNGDAAVSPRTLEYDVTATSREYEPGNTEVEVSLKPKNLIEGDEVTLTATGNLSKEDAAAYESVNLTEITIGGRDKAYYTVAGEAGNVPLTAPVTISQIKAVVENPPTGGTGLTYTGDPLELLTGEGTSNGGTMQYYVGEKDSAEQPDETADWKEDISYITAADAGTYTIWYRANGNIDYATSDLGSITVTIAKAEASVTKAPAAKGGVYDGADHPLVEAGTAEGGTIQYSLEQDGEYSDAIPNSQGAKSYTVWYKVVGDANHKDSEPQSVTVTIEKGEGRGSVTMKDYFCMQTGVDPEPVSDTNGTANVTYTYTVKGRDDYSDTKPTTAGEYTVKAVFAETDNYNAVTATADFTISHHFNEGWEEESDGYHHTCPCNTDVRLQETEFNTVPDGLKDNEALDTVEKITQVLVEEVKKGDSIPENNTAVYDVRLQVKSGGSDWVDVTGENFPEDGITVILPYPEGTDSSYTFTVIHMITTGEDAGQMEKLEPTNSEDGISFTVNSLSPICVGWTAPPSSDSYYYNVAIPSDFEGGSVTTDRPWARRGNKITLTVKPDEGHHFGSITVTNRNGKPVELTDNGDGTYTFIMPYGKVTVEAEFVKCSSLDFTDLDTKA